MKTTPLLGKDLMLFSKGKAIALSTSCKLNISAEAMNIASKDSGIWDESIIGKMSWNASSDNMFSTDSLGSSLNSYSFLVELMMLRKPIAVQFGIKNISDTSDEVPDAGWTAPTDGYEGMALITGVEANGSNGDKATFSVTLTGTGKLDKIKTTPKV